MISQSFAEEFAQEWIRAWNSHDLGRVLNHYADDFSIQSPTALKVVPESKGFIAGKENIRSYWQRAMELAPNLEFRLLGVFVGIQGVCLHYINVAANKEVTEVMTFNEELKVAKVLVYHKA